MEKKTWQVVPPSPREAVGAPDQMIVSQHSKSEGLHPSSLPPPVCAQIYRPKRSLSMTENECFEETTYFFTGTQFVKFGAIFF